jgi:hypothetical protein
VTALHGLDAETTLVVIVSKTFTTAETMLNARTARRGPALPPADGWGEEALLREGGGERALLLWRAC